MDLRLVSHPLCPCVQRARITAAEKGLALRLSVIDFADKPARLHALSPTGRVPLPEVEGTVLFESAAIPEFLDEIAPGTLAEIAALDAAADAQALAQRGASLIAR